MRSVNKAGLDLIKSFEKCVLHPYDDGAGYMTIGWGHLIRRGEHFEKITQAEADDLLELDLAQAIGAVSRLVKVPLNDNQFGALVSFTFNVGGGGLGRSSLLKSLNAGKYAEVPERLMVWNKAGGKVLAGLTRRRREEGKLFMTPSSTSIPAPAIASEPSGAGAGAAPLTPAAPADPPAPVPAIEPVAGGRPDDPALDVEGQPFWKRAMKLATGGGISIAAITGGIQALTGLSPTAQVIIISAVIIGVVLFGLVVLIYFAADQLLVKYAKSRPDRFNVK